MTTDRKQIRIIGTGSTYFTGYSYSNILLASAVISVSPQNLPLPSPTVTGPNHMVVQVALKFPRFSPGTTSSEQLNAVIADMRERSLNIVHNNVSPILGLYMAPDRLLAVITPFYPNGNIMDYVRQTPSADKITLIKAIGRGLAHLHEKGIMHANFIPNNILIDERGEPHISDAEFYHSVGQINSRTHEAIPFSWPYKPSEELLPPGNGRFNPTMQADVYALGSVVCEVITGRPPYPRNHQWRGIQKIITQGHITLRQPAEIDDRLWGMIQKCWARNPLIRPTMTEVTIALETLE